ncbi:MAG: XdhC family protein [FCB group bacterium]|jgi:xanthine dehydrogenase accessory factor|nr:XdhC family protein [FCB group bacterium]
MDVYTKALDLIAHGKPFAWALVLKASGSTPQKSGAMALFEPSGPVWGTLGGGCLEAESRARALRALDDGKPLAFDLSLDEDYGWDDGLICGGKVRILIEPFPSRHAPAWKAAQEALARRERGWLLTSLADETVQVRWVRESESADLAELASEDDLLASLDTERPLYREASSLSIASIEPIVAPPRLLIAGGGHVGQALARLGVFLGFEVTVVDDRALFTDPQRYPEGVRTVCADIADTVAAFPAAADTYIVIVTRGHRHDADVLERCIHVPAAYLGMIGSKRKILLIRKQFIERGIATEEDFARVHSPMGLDIGSVTVPEIATSIAAELVAVRRKRTGAGRSLSIGQPA